MKTELTLTISKAESFNNVWHLKTLLEKIMGYLEFTETTMTWEKDPENLNCIRLIFNLQENYTKPKKEAK